ncbi:MAG: hypothetical protein AB7D43_04645 [Sulfurimonadaceae bacterium]|jgi:hypothetical protein
MHTLTAIAMALLFVILVYILIILLYIVLRFLYKFTFGSIISKVSQKDTEKYLFTGYFTNRKFLKVFTIIFFMMHLIAYSSERIRLVNNDRAYLDAKEYFAASGVVTLYRKILNNYFEIDSPVMTPLNNAHMMFYEKGIELIPETDGEYDYWNYRFNLYYYVRKHYVPWDDDKSGYMFGVRVYKFYKPVIRELMDESFTTIQAMMQKPFKDKVLLNDERYRLLTRLAVYYEMHALDTYKLNCAIQTKCTLLYAKDTVLPKRDELILYYMHQALQFFKKNNVEGRASHIADALLVWEWITSWHLDEVIGKDMFTCENHYVQEYIKVHQEFEKLTKNRGYSSISKELREKLYEQRLFSSSKTRIMSYLVKKECGIKLTYKSLYPSNFSEEKLINNIKDDYNE